MLYMSLSSQSDFKPRVLLQLGHSTDGGERRGFRPQTFQDVSLQQSTQQGAQLGREKGGDLRLVPHDQMEELLAIRCHKGGISGGHFKEKTADGPPVHRLSVGGGGAQHLRSHVVVRSANTIVAHRVVIDRVIWRVRTRRLLLPVVANAEVAHHDVSRAAKEDVLRLDVAMDDPARVQVVDRQNHLGDVKTSCVLRRSPSGSLPHRKSHCR